MSNSPIRIAYEAVALSAATSRRRRGREFAILDELRRDGFTDYIVYAVPFADGGQGAFARHKGLGGFEADELALFEAMIPAVAFNLEVQALRRTARTLLDTCIGAAAVRRPRAGGAKIQRGTGETIRAVIWLCDLRGFTSLSEAPLPRDALIDLLNSYFGPMCDAVAEAGGEILKFIGDAMLAIFPTGADPAKTCGAALIAAERAQAALTEENRRRESAGLPRIEYGLALHVGDDVMYGNIGSDTRLDFTVIGPAVNLTARIESMCRQLGRQLLLSSDFVSTRAGSGKIPRRVFAERRRRRSGSSLFRRSLPYGCRITLPIAFAAGEHFNASAVCASGNVRSTCDEILPSAVHLTSFSRLARFFSGLSRVHAPQNTPRMSPALQQRQIERHLRDVAGRKADHQEAAFPGDGAQRSLHSCRRRDRK